MSDNQNSRIYSIVISILLFLAAVLGWFFWQKSQTYKAENALIEQERLTLEVERTRIESELDSLSGAYSDLRTENESLQGRVTSTAAEIQKKEVQIKSIKAQTSKDVQSLRAQVTELQRVKTEYETIISVIQTENEQLKTENLSLKEQNSQLKGEKQQLSGQVTDLGKQVEEQIRRTQSATFKATSFNVKLERGNDKSTVKAGKAREVNVGFDLADVPPMYQGPQKLYMAITDDKGNPIGTANPIKATVYAPTGPVEIIAQQVKQVNLETTQRLSFVHKLDDKLKSGNYVVAIYCDKGLLGASSFAVR